MGQVVTKQELLEIIKKGRHEKQTYVATNGCFDILHVGHVRYLQKSKTFADNLVIMLNSDSSVRSLKGDNRPVNSQDDRAEILSALSCVDYVVLFEEKSPANLLDEIKPDVYTKGADYTMDTLPERDIVKKNNIKVEFVDFVKGKSTTNTINKINLA